MSSVTVNDGSSGLTSGFLVSDVGFSDSTLLVLVLSDFESCLLSSGFSTSCFLKASCRSVPVITPVVSSSVAVEGLLRTSLIASAAFSDAFDSSEDLSSFSVEDEFATLPVFVRIWSGVC